MPRKTPAPAIVVLQEIFGVNAFVRVVCDNFAELGYVAIAPDLFWRQEADLQLDSEIASERALGMKLRQGMDEQLAVEDAKAALAYLRSTGECNGKIGSVGYCLGGKLAYVLATTAKIDAAVSYYGVGMQAELERTSKLCAPLLLHIASDDQMCPLAEQERIIQSLGGRPDVTIATYDGVGHAFARPGSSAYVEVAARRANALTNQFLTKYLKNAE